MNASPFAVMITKAAHLLSYFKTLSVGPVWGLNPGLSTAASLFKHATEKASEASAKHAPTRLSLLFCTGVQFSGDSFRAFNDRIKIRENRGV